MVDNINVSEGAGKTVATEDIGGAQYQIIKVVGGPVGSTSMMTVFPDGSIPVSMIGAIRTSITGGISSVTQAGAWTVSVVGTITTNPGSVSGAINVSGSVMLGSSNASVIAVIQGSIAAVSAGVANQSVSGAINISGSVLLGSSNASVIGVTQGSVASAQVGTRITSVISALPSSMLVGASIFGQLPAGTAPLGSVATLQGTTPWINTNVGSIITTNIGSVITVLQSSSIIAINAGSVIAVPSGSTIGVWQNASIAGTYAEDAAAATGDRGIFVLGVRNDTLSSVTSADGDYSSFVLGPSGEHIVANAPFTKWVQGTADLRGAGSTGVSVVAIAAQGASIFTYVTGVQILNLGSASVLVTLCSTGSTLGYTIAPAGGGSNIVYPNALKTPANGTFAASLSGVASVMMSAQGFIAKI